MSERFGNAYWLFILGYFVVTGCGVTLKGYKQVPLGDEPISKSEMKQKVVDEFLYAWNDYKKYAWGHDALKPLSQSYHDWYDQTLLFTPVDAYSTMHLMGLKPQMAECKKLILEQLNFNADIEVSHFESTIRLLGGLLSAYELDGDQKFLTLAKDLADRMSPVFNTATGMPMRYVNLKTGATRDYLSNPAEIGTLLIEYGTLSKHTGEKKYFDRAKKALVELYKRKSKINLVGSTIDVRTGIWTNPESHISGGIDSYYEYLYKCAILFKDDELMTMAKISLDAATKYLKESTADGVWYEVANMNYGTQVNPYFGALDCFFPGTLIYAGYEKDAKQLMESVIKYWIDYSIEPEYMNYKTKQVLSPQYVLRPEAIESAYYLYYYTGDERYLRAGKRIFDSIVKFCKHSTGYAALRDVRTLEKMDQMESFFFAETLKYAFLIFNEDINVFNFDKYVLNTEAHPILK